jgi:hypothetical protein
MAEAITPPPVQVQEAEVFPLAPLVRWPLLLLYLALALPLPLMATAVLRPVMAAAVPLGLVLILALLSERVVADEAGLRREYPGWADRLFALGGLLPAARAWRRGWSLPWTAMDDLVPVGTSQGGRVYYIRTHDRQHLLLPQRVARFERFLELVRQRGGLPTGQVRRLTPPWTYAVLAALSLALLAAEGTMALRLGSVG